jgi:phage terminase large subunit GpA-like protein
VVEGGPERAETWSELGLLLDRTWPHACGTRIGLAKLAIDTGYEAPAVYAWARRMGHAQVAPIGVDGFNRSAPVAGPTHVDVTEGGKKLRRGARLWTIAVATLKSETYRFLRLAPPTDEEVAAGSNGRSCESGTRRWTAVSMLAPRPGSPEPTAGPRPCGATSRTRSACLNLHKANN